MANTSIMATVNTKGKIKQEVTYYCRVCLVQNEPSIYLFAEDLIENIKFCTGVEFTEKESLSNYICDQCMQDLNRALRFKENCLLADKKIQIQKCVELNSPANKIDSCDSDTGFRIEEVPLKKEVILEDNKYSVQLNVGIVDLIDCKIKKEPISKINDNNNIKVKKTRSPRLYCTICDIKFDTKKNSDAHKQIHRGSKINDNNNQNIKVKKTRSPRLYCTICDIKFDTKKNSDAHKKMHKIIRRRSRPKRLKKRKEFKVCEFCGREFQYLSSYAYHMHLHNPNLTYHCNDCDYKTWAKSDLKKHVLIHLGIKNHQCTICSQFFRVKTNLLSHIRRVHEKLHKCTCEVCGRGFYDKAVLRRHMITHTGIKGFNCEECYKKFSSRKNWKRHLLTTHNIKIPALKSGRRRQEL